jgi:hypothetical protein
MDVMVVGTASRRQPLFESQRKKESPSLTHARGRDFIVG